MIITISGVELVNIMDDSAPVILCTMQERLNVQLHMIKIHKYYLDVENKKNHTEEEAARSWVFKGYAVNFAKHYKLKPKENK
jgi:hypothetical protein